jgi:hexosaminidase
MKHIATAAIIAPLLIALSSCVTIQTVPPAAPIPTPEISVVPKPANVERLPGSFAFTPGMKLLIPAGNSGAREAAAVLAARLGAAAGFDLAIIESSSGTPSEAPAAGVVFRPSPGPALPTEGYVLTATPANITIEAGDASGFLYGVQTLFQLLPPAVFSNGPAGSRAAPPPPAWTVPAVRITDSPRYPWRGVLLDVGRHFFPASFIKTLLDELALHKMNTFHWHLTDDQGWRIEIKKYPRLTEVGAWRVDREDKHWNARPAQQEGEPATYGGFYTQAEVRDIVAYAAARGITVVPEIEMPGHCQSALAAYPQYSCTGGPFTVPPGGVWPITNVYCPGNDETFTFLQDVLDEVITLFPSPTIHIGGDEVDKTNWKKCPKGQARMAAEGLRTEEELQSWFVKRIERYINSKGKKLIGWDEILEGGLAPNAAVMSWRGTQGGITAARSGHDVVMTPTSHCYFDYYQGRPDGEPLAIGGSLPLRKVYELEPAPAELTADEAAHILGGQANLWTEYISTPAHAEYMLFPRLAALAEIVWSPRGSRDWKDFAARLPIQLERYRRAGINFAESAYNVALTPELDPKTSALTLTMSNELGTPEVRYRTDGRNPTPDSPLYTTPLRLKRTAAIRAGTFRNGLLVGKISDMRFLTHKALGKAPKLAHPYKDRYKGGGDIGLVNGLRGSKSHTDGQWQGYEGDDLDAVIDLGREERISAVTIGFLQNINAWIFLPSGVEIAVSADGKDFKTVATIANEVSPQAADIVIEDFAARLDGVKARYLRVVAKTIGVCPPGHPGAGGKAWLFADEIIVD